MESGGAGAEGEEAGQALLSPRLECPQSGVEGAKIGEGVGQGLLEASRAQAPGLTARGRGSLGLWLSCHSAGCLLQCASARASAEELAALFQNRQELGGRER